MKRGTVVLQESELWRAGKVQVRAKGSGFGKRELELLEGREMVAGWVPDGNLHKGISQDSKQRTDCLLSGCINGVSDSVLNQLLDKLLQHGAMINEEMQTAKTKPRAEKARDVIDTLMRKGHESSKTLIEALREVDPCLSRELKLW
ncbi:unnamed protein product [Menidia menidia]|uniref:(Atlantic silverside) hypothetical protein n=1 Tax=Menidia menidia TaxID=238744 RepID=A0A8S4BS55_9TELE|nr:unnamed protein product [Menidia menidia]